MACVDGFIAFIRHAAGILPSRRDLSCKYRSSLTNRTKESLDEGASGVQRPGLGFIAYCLLGPPFQIHMVLKPTDHRYM